MEYNKKCFWNKLHTPPLRHTVHIHIEEAGIIEVQFFLLNKILKLTIKIDADYFNNQQLTNISIQLCSSNAVGLSAGFIHLTHFQSLEQEMLLYARKTIKSEMATIELSNIFN